MSFFRKNIMRMAGYIPGEQPRDRRYVKLNTNENPYPPSPRVSEVLAGFDLDALRRYPDPNSTALRETIARVMGVPASMVMAGNGSDELLSYIVRAFVQPGAGSVAYPVPTYSLYRTLVEMNDVTAVEIPWADGYTIPPALADAGAAVTILCNPNAPTGTVVALDDIRDLARRVKGVLVVDEAYVDFADTSALALASEFDNVVVCRTASKSYSLAGLRLGWMIAPQPIVSGLMDKIKDSYNLSALAQAVGVAALEDQDHMKTNAERIRTTRERLYQALTALGFNVTPSQSNFLWAVPPKLDARTVYAQLKDRGILIRVFSDPVMNEAVRITVGTDDEIDQLLTALRDILAAGG